MKKNSLKIISAVVLGLFAISTTVRAIPPRAEVIEAKQITKEEAEKKYPPPKGGYPSGERDPHQASGQVSSPYPPHKQFDCSKIQHGALVLDTYASKVFVRP
jgi:hypothetical protein